MVVFNYSTRELTTKVVFYGPGLCGKTTNLQFIYDHMPQGVRGKMLSLATKSDRTLFFDFLPIDLGQIQGMKTKVQLYTVPGQVFYNETRRLVLKGADGVVFVADSQENMVDANLDSFRNLEENLAAHGMSLEETPHVIQYNKRDLPNAMPIEPINERLNKYNAPFYEAIATTGVGVQETLRHITKLVLLKLNDRYGAERPGTARREPTRPSIEAPPVPASEPLAPTIESPVAAVAAGAPLFDEPSAGAEAPAPADPAEVFAMPSGKVFAAAPEPPAESFRPALSAAARADASGDFDFAPPAEPSRAEMPTLATPQAVLRAATQPPTAPPRAGAQAFDAEPFPVPARPERPLAAAALEEEDVLGLAPPAPPPTSTVKIDRATLDAALSVAPAAQASARMIEVGAADALFAEDALEPTRLEVGEPQEILVPLEFATAAGTRRFRLVIRLELAP
jgi:signal recognition particle receptor subunit beta